MQLEWKEESTWESEGKTASPLADSFQKKSVITCGRFFNFDNVSKIEDKEPERAALQFEKQHQMEQFDYFSEISSPLLPPMQSPVKSASTPVKAFHSISELIKKDTVETNPTTVTEKGGLTIINPQSININLNDTQQSVLLYSAHAYPSAVMGLGSPNSSSVLKSEKPHDMLLIQSNAKKPIFPASNSFSSSESMVKPNLIQQNISTTKSSGSSYPLEMAGPSQRSASVTKIRFRDDQQVNISITKSEPSTPTPVSPLKKSILKNHNTDSFFKWGNIWCSFCWVFEEELLYEVTFWQQALVLSRKTAVLTYFNRFSFSGPVCISV